MCDGTLDAHRRCQTCRACQLKTGVRLAHAESLDMNIWDLLVVRGRSWRRYDGKLWCATDLGGSVGRLLDVLRRAFSSEMRGKRTLLALPDLPDMFVVDVCSQRVWWRERERG